MDGANTTGFKMKHNVIGSGGVVTGNSTQFGKDTLDFYAPGYDVQNNVFVGMDPTFQGWMPAGNHFTGSINDVGFANPAALDYSLHSNSPYAATGAGIILSLWNQVWGGRSIV
jgi:hypothetical protein